jgi:O-antigen/teichoic acid export membrane protein
MKFILSYLKHPGSQALLANFFPQAFAVLNFSLAAHWLLPEALGAWALFLTLASLVEMARYGLIQGALVHFRARTPETELPLLKGAALGLGLVAGGVLATGLALAGWGLNFFWKLPGLGQLLFWYPLVAICLSLVRWHDMLRLAEQDFRSITRSAIYFGAAYLCCLLLTKYFSPAFQPVHLLLAQIPAALLTSLLLYKNIKTDSRQVVISRRWMGQMGRFGQYGMGANLMSMLFQRADIFLLGAFVSPAALAVYNVAVRLVTWLDFPLNALSQIYFPRIAKASHETGAAGTGEVCERATGLLLAISIPVGIIAFFSAPLLVRLLAGAAYMQAAPLFQILVLATVAKPWGRLLGMALEASGKPQWNFVMVGISLGVNLICLLALTPCLGIEGAAIASTGSIFITTIAGQLYFKKIMPYSRKRSIMMVWHYYCELNVKSLY